MFHLFDPEFYRDHPQDAARKCADILSALALPFGQGAVDLNEREADGYSLLLDAVSDALNDAASIIQEMISEPWTAGYNEGMKDGYASAQRGDVRASAPRDAPAPPKD